jgi:predicted PurR-regulated permease PerM
MATAHDPGPVRGRSAPPEAARPAPAAGPAAPAPPSTLTFRRVMMFLGLGAAIFLAYLLRGVIVPLFLAFLLAYALDPFVDRMEAVKVPRALGAALVMLGILGLFLVLLIYGIPLLLDELRAAAADFPDQIHRFETRIEPWLWQNFHLKLPHTMNELGRTVADRLQGQFPNMATAASSALFGTLSYVAVILSALIVPVFALYLLIDFDRIVSRVGELIPRRWHPGVADVAKQIHRTLGGYVRGQLTANIVLASLYATGLRLVDIRLAVPIGVLTGMLAFVPYIGFATGLLVALAMATLDWHGPGPVLGVIAVMGGVQILDGMVITPRIVGRSVGLAPLEVLVTMMASASLFGFLGVLLAVPLGAVVKILVTRAIKAYLTSDFYKKPPEVKA